MQALHWRFVCTAYHSAFGKNILVGNGICYYWGFRFLWMGFGCSCMINPDESKRVNSLELEYIEQDKKEEEAQKQTKVEKLPFGKIFIQTNMGVCSG